MTELSTNHAVWAGVVLTLAKTCLPFVGRQIEKLVDAWCKRIEATK